VHESAGVAADEQANFDRTTAPALTGAVCLRQLISRRHTGDRLQRMMSYRPGIRAGALDAASHAARGRGGSACKVDPPGRRSCMGRSDRTDERSHGRELRDPRYL
jgi:hypothetical protein